MEKFDVNNNPVFSKNESRVINFLAYFGFGSLCLVVVLTLCFTYFYPLFLAIKNMVIQYPALVVLIFFLVVFVLSKIAVKTSKWLEWYEKTVFDRQ